MGGAVTCVSSSSKLSDYSIGSIIGMGGFGKIREIRQRKKNIWYAMKVLDLHKLTKSEAEVVLNEVFTLKALPSHPLIIKHYATFRDKQSISFVMDLLPGGDLRTLFKLKEQFTEKKSAYIIACIGSALHHLHLHRIIHRDIKPENIMFDACGVPKLIDFGISHLFPTSSSSWVCNRRSGTKEYLSPEMLVPKTHYHSFETDYWSLGIVLYELLFGSRPSIDMEELVKYSQMTYAACWAATDSEPLQYQTEPLDWLRFDPSSSSDLATPLPCHPAFQKFEDGPLSTQLTIPIPQETSLKMPVSEHCKSHLSSLLDVRIHKRLGVGENYLLFERHPWFEAHNLQVSAIARTPSPLHLDIETISNYNSLKLLKVNMEDALAVDAPVSSDVEELLQQISFD